MQKENLSLQQSIDLIQSMIDKTKSTVADGSVFFLLWGWIVFIACIPQYILKNVLHYQHHYYAWFIIFMGIAGSVYMSIKKSKTTIVKTYISEGIEQLWLGVAISFMALAFIFAKIGYEHSFPFYIMFYAIGCFITGRLIHFSPLVWGSIGAWLLAILSVYLDYDTNIMVTAVTILISYLIPGYLLHIKYKKINAE
jgi:hypothetical protein